MTDEPLDLERYEGGVALALSGGLADSVFRKAYAEDVPLLVAAIHTLTAERDTAYETHRGLLATIDILREQVRTLTDETVRKSSMLVEAGDALHQLRLERDIAAALSDEVVAARTVIAELETIALTDALWSEALDEAILAYHARYPTP